MSDLEEKQNNSSNHNEYWERSENKIFNSHLTREFTPTLQADSLQTRDWLILITWGESSYHEPRFRYNSDIFRLLFPKEQTFKIELTVWPDITKRCWIQFEESLDEFLEYDLIRDLVGAHKGSLVEENHFVRWLLRF